MSIFDKIAKVVKNTGKVVIDASAKVINPVEEAATHIAHTVVDTAADISHEIIGVPDKVIKNVEDGNKKNRKSVKSRRKQQGRS